jgi:hypothetical protein
MPPKTYELSEKLTNYINPAELNALMNHINKKTGLQRTAGSSLRNYNIREGTNAHNENKRVVRILLHGPPKTDFIGRLKQILNATRNYTIVKKGNRSMAQNIMGYRTLSRKAPRNTTLGLRNVGTGISARNRVLQTENLLRTIYGTARGRSPGQNTAELAKRKSENAEIQREITNYLNVQEGVNKLIREAAAERAKIARNQRAAAAALKKQRAESARAARTAAAASRPQTAR